MTVAGESIRKEGMLILWRARKDGWEICIAKPVRISAPGWEGHNLHLRKKIYGEVFRRMSKRRENYIRIPTEKE